MIEKEESYEMIEKTTAAASICGKNIRKVSYIRWRNRLFNFCQKHTCDTQYYCFLQEETGKATTFHKIRPLFSEY